MESVRDGNDDVRDVMRTLAEHGREFYWFTQSANEDERDFPDFPTAGPVYARTGQWGGETGWSAEMEALNNHWSSQINTFIERSVRDEFGDECPLGYVRIDP